MHLAQLLRSYELLADRADRSFAAMARERGESLKCRKGCSDCCHAVFGLFLIEAAYLQNHFHRLDPEVQKAALLRCNEMERGLRRLEKKMQLHWEDPQMQNYIMAAERIRCPLLNEEQDCVLYTHRPITCRVYGIPARIHGKTRVCAKSGFQAGESYPVFDLDGVYRSLYGLSLELLESEGEKDAEKASLLISVSKVITTPLDLLIREGSE
ncbi:MAG: YkgJ family cysteine cluster protein [Deltaproteobacteria bacterium]|nr:YkgJ family cysteine cluster protein [Deltaproteobacteria bacterium]